MKSFQFFIDEELAKELITFIDDHEHYNCKCNCCVDGKVPRKVKAFVSILRDEFPQKKEAAANDI